MTTRIRNRQLTDLVSSLERAHDVLISAIDKDGTGCIDEEEVAAALRTIVAAADLVEDLRLAEHGAA